MVPITQDNATIKEDTLLGICLCEERIRRQYALEKALERARLRNAQVFQNIFNCQSKKDNLDLVNGVSLLTAKFKPTESQQNNTQGSLKLLSPQPREEEETTNEAETPFEQPKTELEDLQQTPVGESDSISSQDASGEAESDLNTGSRRASRGQPLCTTPETTNTDTETDTEKRDQCIHTPRRCRICGLIIQQKPKRDSECKKRSKNTDCSCPKKSKEKKKKGGDMSERLPVCPKRSSISGKDGFNVTSCEAKMANKGKHRRKSSASIPPSPRKGSKSWPPGSAQPPGESYLCSCSTCCGQTTCCCVEDLEAIEEEHDTEVQFDDQCGPCSCFEEPCPGGKPTCAEITLKPCDEQPQGRKKGSKHTGNNEDSSCEEFFDIMRDTMEDAVKKSLDGVFMQYINCCIEKIDNLANQLERNECILTKIYTDLNDKISYYGERNAQQFQYLCVRMEHDRLFYQQQQEYFLKSRKNEDSDQDDCCLKNMKCSVQKFSAKCTASEHSKSRNWECNVVSDDNETSAPEDANSHEDPDSASEKQTPRGSKSGDRGSEEVKRHRSETSNVNSDSGKKTPKKK